MSKPAEQWAGQFGAAYTARNRVDWQLRIEFWRGIIEQTGVRSVFEVGTNAGWNLSAIRKADPDVTLHGAEVNSVACRQAHHAGFPNVVHDRALEVLQHFENTFDLVFTAGVLIHVPPAELEATMGAIVKASADYVLAVEYASDREEEVEYRGQAGMLWRRPYGALYQAMGLTLVDEFSAGDGFDRCRAWLLTKRREPLASPHDNPFLVRA